MKKLNQIKTAIKIEYCWEKIERCEKREALLKKLLNRVIIKTYQHRKKAEELSLYYETISGYRDTSIAEDSNLPYAA